MSECTSWAALVVAGLLEIAFAAGLKSSAGFARPLVLVATLVALVGSIGLLAFALQALPVGTAYAVWTGIGAAGTVAAGVMFFGDAASIPRLACIGLIGAGVVGLRLTE